LKSIKPPLPVLGKEEELAELEEGPAGPPEPRSKQMSLRSGHWSNVGKKGNIAPIRHTTPEHRHEFQAV
jgi:hypothetical protein